MKMADIKKQLNASLKGVHDGVVRSMRKLGAESLEIARNNANKIDATGILASSIGYVIVADGVVIAREFGRQAGHDTPTAQNADTEAQKAEAYAETLAAQYKNGYALIVVSGSEFAVQAESLSNDVLSSAEMYVGQQLPTMLDALVKKNA